MGGMTVFSFPCADWMPRNLDRRVELLTPVEDPTLNAGSSILDIYFKDTEKARQLVPDGSYKRVKSGKAQEARSQEVYTKRPSSR